jgi:hypothetical protein
MRYPVCIFISFFRKVCFIIFLIPLLNIITYSQDSATYYKILNNSQWIYTTTDLNVSGQYYYEWYKTDIQGMMVDKLINNGVNRAMKLNNLDQLGMNDLLLEVIIDTSSLVLRDSWIFEKEAREKWKILKLVMNVKKLTYFTGVSESYLNIIHRIEMEPCLIPVTYFSNNESDKILDDIDNLVLQFVSDYVNSQNK